jgi:ubiquinol-cytochrome c reductase cytochrome b subunit
MFRSLLYGSHRKPRELLWIFGMLLYLMLMAEAFFGYVLPWGQMSYWGAQVIINLFGAIPTIGEPLTEWIRGDYSISDATLNRFFALHVIAVPLALLALVVLHLSALHEVGSNNPDGVEIHDHEDENGVPLDGIPFHPYYTVKDLFGVAMFLLVFAFVIFFWPEAGGMFLEHDNFTPADPLVTPVHIKPVWYFTPYYGFNPSCVLDLLLMGFAVVILFFMPWLDRSPVRSIRYKGAWYKILVFVFAIAFVRLGMLGMAEGTPAQTWEMRVWTFVYFAFFALLFLLSKGGSTRPVPDRVSH